jgi:tRNA pseudouridine-54 N-methylase
MREFLLYSRTGKTGGDFPSLREAGRLDIVYQCALTSLFVSQAHRRDAVFHAILGGPPTPPVHIEISGEHLRDAHIDERSWEAIFRGILSGGKHPGITIDKTPLQRLVQQKHEKGYKIYVLGNEGDGIGGQDLSGDCLFVVGDHIGIPKHDEGFVLRYGKKVSLGKDNYLAASCIDIVNYIIDRSLNAEEPPAPVELG